MCALRHDPPRGHTAEGTALVTERALVAAEGERQIRIGRGGCTFLHLLAVVLSALIGYETVRHAEQRREVRGAAHEH